MIRISKLFLIACVVSIAAWGQENWPQQLHQPFLLEQLGQFDKAIQILQPLVDSGGLSESDLGKAWTLLGIAYKEQGHVLEAQRAYEHGLHIFETDKQNTANYAYALEQFAALYRAMGQEQAAIRLGLKAAAIDTELGDHSNLARIYTDIAGVAIREHRRKSAQTYLEKAAAESQRTEGLTEDDRANLASTEAMYASMNGKTEEAVTEYRQALDLWRRRHGGQHYITGWGFILLGQALSANGQLQDGLISLKQGLTILEQTVGPQNPKYLVGELLYARALEQSGMHAEASRLRSEAEHSLGSLLNRSCMNCTVSVLTLPEK